jgi:hypothetical protein
MRDQLVTEAATYTTHNKHNRRTSMPSVRFKPVFSTFWIGDWYYQDETVKHSRIEWGQHPLLGIFRTVSLTSKRLLKLLSYCVMSLVTCHTCVSWTVHLSAYEGSRGFAVRMVVGFKENCAQDLNGSNFVCLYNISVPFSSWVVIRQVTFFIS